VLRIAAIVSPILLAALAAYQWREKARVENPGSVSASFVPVPLTTYPGYEIGPTLAPDGARLAFAWTGGELKNMDIYSKELAVGAPARLTFGPERDFSPAWSPDGRWIVFLRELSEAARQFGVIVIPSNGGPEKMVATIKRIPFGGFPAAGFVASWLSWSRDSRWIVASDSEGESTTQQLVAFDLASGERRALTTPPRTGWGDLDPEVSPDGKSVAFARMLGYDSAQLYLLDIDANLRVRGAPRLVTPFKAHMGDLSWAPNGAELLFSVGAVRRTLWRVGAGGSKPAERINLLADFASGARIAGNRLVFVQRRVDTNIWRLAMNGQRELLRPIASTFREGGPQFSPDGRKILYVFGGGGASEVWLANSDGLHARRLAGDGIHDALAPRWSPDGRLVSFLSGAGGVVNLYVVPAAGGAARRISDEPIDASAPNWSRDGRWIYFGSVRAGRSEVFRVPVAGGAIERVTTNGGWFASESGDGKILYYTKGEGISDVWSRPLQGGDESIVLHSISGGFAVSRNSIWFLRRAAPGRFAVFSCNLKSGRTRILAEIDANPEIGSGLTVSPDELSVLYTQIDSEGSDLMVVEGFR
jgi:Tol biopolymer transport system component